ncbi:hypothetical protein [Variovorax sp. YR752]|uniref:hypothetical protein n=1 Tax=Variovorax sp. YR752 TaxID=1884383 RepID=UPI00117FA333|nr:hypothetical protein [Variovorax sp. YR752]
MAKRADFPASDVANAAASLAKDIAAQMPQWKLASSSASVSDAISAPGDSSETQQGVDVATLRAKFLRGRSATDAVATGAARGRNTSVEVFKVEPKKGGPSQIADRRNGKISIVSG